MKHTIVYCWCRWQRTMKHTIVYCWFRSWRTMKHTIVYCWCRWQRTMKHAIVYCWFISWRTDEAHYQHTELYSPQMEKICWQTSYSHHILKEGFYMKWFDHVVQTISVSEEANKYLLGLPEKQLPLLISNKGWLKSVKMLSKDLKKKKRNN